MKVSSPGGRGNLLATQLARLPGVGQRTAQRLAFHLLRVPAEEALALSEAIRIVKGQRGWALLHRVLQPQRGAALPGSAPIRGAIAP